MEQPVLTPMWAHNPGWLAQADAWIAGELRRQDRQVSGPLALVRRLPWSLVLQAPTGSGPVFFKAVAPQLAYEVRVTQALAGWHPDLVLTPLAVDGDQGWLLLPDGGGRLRETVRSQRDPAPLHVLLPQYAAFQGEMAQHATQLLSLGLPDRRLARLPQLYAEILEDTPMLRLGQENGLQPGELAQLQALQPRLAELCARLAAYPIPETIHHGDLNDANVFYDPGCAQAGRFHLIDWGDSSLSHPFFSLRTVLVSLEISMDWDDEDPRGAPFVEQYLQAWQAPAAREDLRAAYRLSRPLAALVGALNWRQAMRAVPEALRLEYAHTVPSLLQEFLQLAG